MKGEGILFFVQKNDTERSVQLPIEFIDFVVLARVAMPKLIEYIEQLQLKIESLHAGKKYVVEENEEGQVRVVETVTKRHTFFGYTHDDDLPPW